MPVWLHNVVRNVGECCSVSVNNLETSSCRPWLAQLCGETTLLLALSWLLRKSAAGYMDNTCLTKIVEQIPPASFGVLSHLTEISPISLCSLSAEVCLCSLKRADRSVQAQQDIRAPLKMPCEGFQTG